MVIEEDSDLPYVYFVRKNYGMDGRDCMQAEQNIEQRLAKRFNMISFFGLNEHMIYRVERDMKEVRLHALVTHVPFNRSELGSKQGESPRSFYARLYGESLKLLWKIKQINPLMPIIAYTGADHGREDIDAAIKYAFQEVGPINAIVFKSVHNEWEKDAAELERILANPPLNFAPMTMPWGEVIH